MSRLALYTSRLFLVRWFSISLGMLVLVGLVDSLANASALPDGDTMFGTLRYMVLRAPDIFSKLFLMVVMLATLLTFTALVRNRELVAILGLGYSVPAQWRMLAPAVFLAAAFSVVVIDQSVPPTIRALDAWRGAEGVPDMDPLWLDDQGTFVEITSLGGDQIAGLTFIERDENGAVQAIRWAEQADYTEDGWRLTGVTGQRFDGQDLPLPLFWETEQTPAALQTLGAEPIDLAVADLRRLSRLRGSGSRPSAAYTAALLNRLTQPLKALVYLFVAAAIMQQPGRGASGDMAMVYGAGIGFLFLVLDGTLMTMAQSGFMNPWIATLSPMGILAFFGTLLWLRQEVAE